MKLKWTALALVLMAGMSEIASAQDEPVQLAAGAAEAKQKMGLIVYPAGGQTPEQQRRDEQACYGWAQQQAGPAAAPPATDSAAQAGKARADSATKGAAMKGAAGGAVIGAIAGDAGKGAGMGAIGGTLRARRAKREAERQAEQQAVAQAEAKANQQAGTLRKAMVACLEGRGYTVQ